MWHGRLSFMLVACCYVSLPNKHFMSGGACWSKPERQTTAQIGKLFEKMHYTQLAMGQSQWPSGTPFSIYPPSTHSGHSGRFPAFISAWPL